MNIRAICAGTAFLFASGWYIGAVSEHPTVDVIIQQQQPATTVGAVAQGTKNPYWQLQTVGDCVEQSLRVAIDTVEGKHVVSEASIDKYAEKVGLYFGPDSGSDWDSTIGKVVRHYGAKATNPASMSKARLTADLKKGDSVAVTLYAGDLWNGTVYDGSIYSDNSPYSADHAVVVESVNSNGTVTLSDGGVPWGNGETVTWTQFSKAWAASDYSAVAISK